MIGRTLNLLFKRNNAGLKITFKITEFKSKQDENSYYTYRENSKHI